MISTKPRDTAETMLTVWRGVDSREKSKVLTVSPAAMRDRAMNKAMESQKLNSSTVLKKKNQWATHRTAKPENNARARSQFSRSRLRTRKNTAYIMKIAAKISKIKKPKMPVPTRCSAASEGALSNRTDQNGDRLKACSRYWEKSYWNVPGPEPRTGRSKITPLRAGLAVS